LVETYYAGAYWHIRKEPPEECGRRAESFFNTLSTIDPSFSLWFKQGNSRKEALTHRIETDTASLGKMFRRGKDKLFEDLGFRLSGWSSGWRTRARSSSSPPSASPRATPSTSPWPSASANCSTAPGCSRPSAPPDAVHKFQVRESHPLGRSASGKDSPGEPVGQVTDLRSRRIVGLRSAPSRQPRTFRTTKVWC
jgi:hypothetical protein